MTPDDARDTVQRTLVRQGLTETDLAARARISARVPAFSYDLPRVSVSLAHDSIASSSSSSSSPAADLVRRALLGRGGMGVVHAAQQRSLGRDVALKEVTKPDDDRRRALVIEGRTMGALEHPNIVPVHALGVDDAGEPLLVMKLVDGVSWRALLEDPGHAWWSTTIAPDGDRLRANVEILMSVCRALSFAHSRGVIHRDVKPDNVMLGRFGEVYLLDWGIALRLDARASEGDGIVGTPGYLAPEMARGDARALDERTDVYLLGATLFEVLAGRPPHIGKTPMAALVSALMGEVPALPADAPVDLADVVRTALHSDPSHRYASVEAFRNALAAYLTADRLVRAADDAMKRADDAVAREGAASTLAYRALVEARFALRAALDLKPGASRTVERNDACVRRLVERELALSSPVSAREAAAELTQPDDVLLARIAALDEKVALEREAAARARISAASNDISAAWKALAVIAIVGIVLALSYTSAINRFVAPPIEGRMRFWGFVVLSLGIGVVIARRKLFATPGGTRLTAALLLWAAVPAVFVAICFFTNQTYSAFAAGIAQAAVSAVIAITLLPRVAPAAVVGICGSIVLAARPDWEVPVMVMLSPVTIGVVVLALRSRNNELRRGQS